MIKIKKIIGDILLINIHVVLIVDILLIVLINSSVERSLWIKLARIIHFLNFDILCCNIIVKYYYYP